ncbi:alkaline phosphatase family protein [Flavisolibacter nicotianae]|uniref:alkaline phosphatase family protein n=1 Tax=Flavisolibacter nicotianae TaxID=2364882 RepID=UPI000EAF482D|nr:ectonucleotide pyrophosphatase/phosphodiesterase [Flavisolibacter nicotianae]
MKKIVFFLILAIGTVVGHSQPARHVLLVSIDGFRPDFYQDKSWPAPNLQKLKAAGVYATGVRSVFPSVTYPSHTTLVTGAFPARHGIYYNAPYRAKKGQWYWEESYIRVPTLWDAVRQAGLTSGAVMWPVTVGAPIDYNFPVRRADNDETSNQLEITRPLVTPAGLLDEIEKKETGPLTVADFDGNHAIDKTIGKMAAYILKTYQPNLMAVHFITVDHMEHAHGRDAVEVRHAVALVDSMIGVLLKTLKEAGLKKNTAVIITGDHGFVNSTHTFSPNVLLQQHGLLTADGGPASFHPAGGSAFLYLKDKGDTATLSKVKAILQALPAEQKAAFQVVDRAELDRVGANPDVALALAMQDGYVANNEAKGELVRMKKGGGNHGYFPDFNAINTGFLAIGAGIGKPNQVGDMGIQDIAPLVGKLLNLPFRAPDGVLVPGILKPGN